MYSILLLPVFFTVVYLYRRFTRISLADIPGPKSSSFLLGNSKELFQSSAGEQEFEWQNQFGGIARIKASFGEDRLWLSDPKALQYVCQTSGYNFPRPVDRREFARLATDDGIVWAEGDVHKRHRKVMLPAFGAPQVKLFFPIFRQSASKLVAKWKELIVNHEEDPEQSSRVINIHPWVGRATLDAIGQAAFDCDFNAMEGEADPLVKSYNDFMRNAFGMATPAKIFFENICHYIPEFILTRLNSFLPGEAMRKVRENRTIVHKLAKDLIKDKSEALFDGKGKKDVMSLLVQANASEDPKTKLSDYEMISQMRRVWTILLAGHETTANSISFTLLELAKHPEVQMKIRQEIREMNAAKIASGDSDPSISDLDSMPYTIAVVKESFRMHPIVYHITRNAGKDDVLPLSEPITTNSGHLIREVPVPKGTNLTLSFAAYNRNKKIWGNDADDFRPERWLETKERCGPAVGVYANLLTFSAGVRACIGWRFAVVEVQTFLIELVSNFEFTMTKESQRVRRLPCAVMVPVIAGEEEKGAQLPLKVSVAVT